MPAQSEPYQAPAIVTFAKELEWRRTSAGLSKKELAAILGFADSYVGQIELCKNLPSREFAEALDTYFKTDGLFVRLRDRIHDTRHQAVLPPGFTQYLEYEARADCLRIFTVNLVSGLFQTEAYARTIMSTFPRVDASRIVAERMQRKAIFEREDRPYAFLIMDEGVIRRNVGGKEVMREQLAYLLDVGQSEKSQLQIVPNDVGYYAGLAGSFTILGFRDGAEVSYTESCGDGILLQQRGKTARHAVTWDLVQGHTLAVEESLSLVREAMEQL